MSAVALQNELYVRSSRKLTELEATLQISRVASLASDLWSGLEAVAEVALQIPGIRGIELAGIKKTAWGTPLRGGTPASALAQVINSGRHWGELRLYFELQPSPIEAPLRFARFLAQQMAGLLTRFELRSQRESLRSTAKLLETVVIRKKAIHRAKALLVHAHRLSEDESLLLLKRYSQQTGKTLHQVADAVILSEKKRWLSRSIGSTAKHRTV